MPAEEGQKLRHSCSTCSRSFSNKRDLVKHQYMHREKPNLVCLHCNKTFTTESNYRRHINALQNVEKKGYSCGNCGSLFRRLRDLEQHHELKHRDDKVFRCQVCQAEFSWHENLLKHQQVHEVNPHICTVCNREFIDMTSLLVHRRTHHLPSSSSAATAEMPHTAARTMISQQPEALSEKPFTCHICGRGFKFDFSYQAHLDAHVVPALGEKSVDVGQGCEPTSHSSKPVYVQMDSEGIIDLPAFSSSTNEDVEIIVEVGNVTTPTLASGKVAAPISLQNPLISDKIDEESYTCMTSEMDKRTANDGELLKTSEPLKAEQIKDSNSVTGIKNDHQEQKAALAGSITENGRDNVVSKADENEGPPVIDRMDVDTVKPWPAAVMSFNSYSTKPKKPTKRKRERVPFQFNCVMTDNKPFVCSTCGEAFRWEISLQVHTKVHTEGKVPGVRKIYNTSGAADKKKILKCKEKVKNGESVQVEPGMKKSRIVYRRDSSDEEDVEEDKFDFGNDPEQKESMLVAISHGKFSQRTLRPDDADDMLQEYLVGNESLISLQESKAHAEDERENCHVQPEGVALQKKIKETQKTFKKKSLDNSWKKGKAILRKKRMWKPSKQRPGAQTDAVHSDKESVCQEAPALETPSGSLGDSLGDCSMAVEQSECDARPFHLRNIMDVDRDEEEKKPSSTQNVVEQLCLAGICAADAAVVATGEPGSGVGLNDDRVAMTAAYTAVVLPVAEPGLLQNGMANEEPLTDAGAEQSEDAVSCPVAMDTSCIFRQQPVSEQVQMVSACSSGDFSSSLAQQTDETVTGKKSPSLEDAKSAPDEAQLNVSFSDPILSQGTEKELLATAAGLVPLQASETDAMRSPLQLGKKESNATTCKLKHVDNGSTRIFVKSENDESPKDSVEDDLSSQRVIKDDVVSRIDLKSDQHCLNEELSLPPTSAPASFLQGKKALYLKRTKLENVAGASSELDQILVKDMTLKSKYSIKQRNLRQRSTLLQSFKRRCFLEKGFAWKKRFLKKSARGGSVIIPSDVPELKQEVIAKHSNCGRCGKHFTSDRSLKRHRMLHQSLLKTVSVKCSCCGKHFSTMASLDQHLISLHASSVASCETCRKQFATVDSFVLHQQHGCVFSAFESK